MFALLHGLIALIAPPGRRRLADDGAAAGVDARGR
jgi:hypothetical protein